MSEAMAPTETPPKITVRELIDQWNTRIAEHRNSQASCQRHGMPDLSKWHEGQADAYDRAVLELEHRIIITP